MTTNSIIRFENVSKSYSDGTVVLKNINLELEKGKFYTLLGPSGCGKTTILRIIAGFTEPTTGDIFFHDKKLMQYLQMNVRSILFFKIMRYFLI